MTKIQKMMGKDLTKIDKIDENDKNLENDRK